MRGDMKKASFDIRGWVKLAFVVFYWVKSLLADKFLSGLVCKYGQVCGIVVDFC